MSLITFDIISVLSPKGKEANWNCFIEIENCFFKWIDSVDFNKKKKEYLFEYWDMANRANELLGYIKKNNIEITDSDLNAYIKLQEEIDEEFNVSYINNEINYNINEFEISEEQKKFKKENSEKYTSFILVSSDKRNCDTLGGIQVWIYGNDSKSQIPHCNVFNFNKSSEIEINLIDFGILNIISSSSRNELSNIEDNFRKWISEKDQFGNEYNKNMLYAYWNYANKNNKIHEYVKDNGIKVSDEYLEKFLMNFNA